MLTQKERSYILSRAYIPEHIFTLIFAISDAEPNFFDSYVYYLRENWLIFVGYPLSNDSRELSFSLKYVLENYKPKYMWVIAGRLPDSLKRIFTEKNRDKYYKLDLASFSLTKNLRRSVRKAFEQLTISRDRKMSKEHIALIKEFISSKPMDDYARQLFLNTPKYVERSPTAVVINAWDKKGRLSAFYVVDLSAKRFSVYLIGVRSEEAPKVASDILFYEMVRLSATCGKDFINLGLGVNEGIRGFKEKWGGKPFLDYHLYEYNSDYVKILTMVEAWGLY